jgi:hypothetical protein
MRWFSITVLTVALCVSRRGASEVTSIPLLTIRAKLLLLRLDGWNIWLDAAWTWCKASTASFTVDSSKIREPRFITGRGK